jgi:orotate phosphoribosyltransferase
VSDREALIAHLLEHSIRTGDFTLKSGRKSTWFCDAKQTACRAEGILLVADAALAELDALDAAAAAEGVGPITAIGGLTAGADPVAFGIAAVAATRGRHLRSFSIRKESKDHGVQGRLAGALLPGDRVVITEDTVTRGTSPLEAAAAVRALGAEPVAVLPIVDRGGTCGAAAAETGIAFRPLVTALDLGFPYEGP